MQSENRILEVVGITVHRLALAAKGLERCLSCRIHSARRLRLLDRFTTSLCGYAGLACDRCRLLN